MRVELDHLFVCTAAGAPEAERLLEFGLREAPPNQHPGQGTANRRFSFANAMLELLWVSDATEAQNECTRRTLLWERWSGRHSGASPFGICLRPVGEDTEPPFPAWEYRPAYLPDPLVMHIADTGVEEPMWVYLNFMRREHRERNFVEHPAGIRDISAVTITTLAPLRSAASHAILKNGVLSDRVGAEHLIEIEFDGNCRNLTADFRPHMPIVFRL